MLARAFYDDPAWVWLIPDPKRRARLLPWLFRVGFDITAADVWVTAGTVRGAARWLPPGRPPMRVGAMLRAYDKKSGKELGAVYMPAGQTGTPMTYTANGKQYIALTLLGGQMVALTLP